MDVTQQLDFAFSSGDAPRFEQWIGAWCIEETARQSLVAQLQNFDLSQHLAQHQQSAASRTTQRQDSDSVAVIRLQGVLQKHSSSFSRSGSTVLARRDIRAAVKDPDIGAIFLAIESPGGTAAGTFELFNEIVAAAKQKPVHAHIEDLGASAAYWAASGATHLTANEPASIGSIGTYTVVEDWSQRAAATGVKVHVIRSAEFKGMGVPGTSITESQIAHLQDQVSRLNERFLNGVSEGRNLSRQQVDAVATGKTYSSEESKLYGLIDATATFEEAFSATVDAAHKHLNRKSTKGKPRMSDSTVTVAAIKQACPGAGNDFVVACLESGKSMEDIQADWRQAVTDENAKLKAQNEELQEENAKLKAENDKLAKQPEAASKSVGTDPISAASADTDSDSLDGASQYWAKVGDLQAAGKDRPEAMKMVNKQYPDLRRAMSAASQPTR